LRLVKAGEIRNRQESDAALDADGPFLLPETWCWVPATYPARAVSDLNKKIQTKDVIESGRFPVVDQGKVFIRGYSNDPKKVIRVTEPVILFGDHTRETKLIDFDFVVGADGVKLLQPIEIFSRYYFLVVSWLPLDSRGYGRHFKLLRESYIPLPPMAEQHRIVAKVDELMALCDRLEAARTAREATRDRLAAASLARLVTPDPETFPADARFALDALPALTTRPDQIKYFRQTILNLAALGKLVAQKPNDDSAPEQLRAVMAERLELVRSRQIRSEEALTPIDPGSVPWEIPQGWVWSRLGNAVLFTQYGTSKKALPIENGVPVLTMGNIQNGMIIYKNEKKIPKTSDCLPGLYLKKLDLLFNRTNSAELVGKIGIFLGSDDEHTFASYLIRLRPSAQHTNPHFLNHVLNAPLFRETQVVPIIKKQTGQANVNGTALKNMLIPFPPLEEQHRIVAKVNALMTLCDALEASLTGATATRTRLLEAALRDALHPFAGNPIEAAA
jgi:type I restriction enzyme S subunit